MAGDAVRCLRQGRLHAERPHFVSWHWATFPTAVDVDKFALRVRGSVNNEMSLSLKDCCMACRRVELAAVSQCAGNSRDLFRAARGRRRNGRTASMSNARWTGVRLKDVLDRAGVKPGARQVRFGGLDEADPSRRAEIHEIARHRSRARRRGHDRLRHERPANADAERFSDQADRAGLVRRLLDQGAERHRGARRARPQLLDDDRLPRSRTSRIHGRARRKEPRSDPDHR